MSPRALRGGLIVNADDFGLHASCTRAIAEAFSLGLVSSATMCANGAAFPEACDLARSQHLEGRIGIHLNLTEGRPLSAAIQACPRFCDGDGAFHGRIRRNAPLAAGERRAVHDELSAQIQRLRAAGLPVTHADSHHHVHTGPFLSGPVMAVLADHGLGKLRIHRNLGDIPWYKRVYKAGFNLRLRLHGFTGADRFGSFEDFQRVQDPGTGLTEVMVHPDYDPAGGLVDRVYLDGAPAGRPLQDLAGRLAPFRLLSYADL